MLISFIHIINNKPDIMSIRVCGDEPVKLAHASSIIIIPKLVNPWHNESCQTKSVPRTIKSYSRAVTAIKR